MPYTGDIGIHGAAGREEEGEGEDETRKAVGERKTECIAKGENHEGATCVPRSTFSSRCFVSHAAFALNA